MAPYDRDSVCYYNDHDALDCLRSAENGNLVLLRDRKHFNIIHADCWTIVERIIGHQAGDRLDLFFQAMMDGWDTISYGVEGLVIMRDWEGIIDLGNNYHHKKLAPVTDPIDIPLLRTVISRCMKTTSSKGYTKEASLDTMVQVPVSRVSSGLPGAIPVEIRGLILSQLPEWSNVENTLEAFSWELPHFFWRDWFPRDLIFDELDGIPDYKIDWKMLYESLMQLLNTSLGMMNRQRIIRVIKETREHFFELLENNPIPGENLRPKKKHSRSKRKQ